MGLSRLKDLSVLCLWGTEFCPLCTQGSSTTTTSLWASGKKDKLVLIGVAQLGIILQGYQFDS